MLNVSGATVFNSTLNVTNAITCNSTLNCNNTVTLGSNSMSGGKNIKKRQLFYITAGNWSGTGPYTCIVDISSVMSVFTSSDGNSTSVYVFRLTAWTDTADFGNASDGTICYDVFISSYSGGKCRLNSAYASGGGLSISWTGAGSFSNLIFNSSYATTVTVVVDPISSY